MVMLTVTSKGQITLRKDVLQHLGIGPGDKLEIDFLPDRKLELMPFKPPAKSVSDFIGLLEDKNGPSFTIDEINEAIAASWAGEE